MADSLLEAAAAAKRQHKSDMSDKHATISHTSAKGAFTCSMLHMQRCARPHAARATEC